ncbi:hypothetical protein GCM10023189_39150 [Nibrella saemangeumensis]|uniref:5-methylcytosine-specific restriction enzyme subunit McrC n=1 Tax=Nibrella saemangeumensis TaxID=1084526 RepID=A0ABP8N7B1_9BACT
MESLFLQEHATSEPVLLQPDEIKALLRLAPHLITIKPAEQGWRITTHSWVGSMLLPTGRTLVVQPKVPINNLLFMLASQYQLAQWERYTQLDACKNYDLLDIYVFVLLEWLEKLLQRGMLKEYQTLEEDLARVKGKYKVGRIPTEQTRFRCEYDELSHQTVMNGMLRGTLRLALQLPLQKPLLTRVKNYYRRLAETGEVNLTEAMFQRLAYNKLNRHYQSIINLCYLIFSNTVLHERSGESLFSGFLVDMNRLFEDFIRSTIQRQLPERRVVKSVKTNWAQARQTISHLPALIPDILIEGRKILDTKYYRNAIHQEKLHSAHLYQLATYCGAYQLDGILVYPENGQAINESYQYNDTCLSIRTIKLDGTIAELIQSVEELTLS